MLIVLIGFWVLLLCNRLNDMDIHTVTSVAIHARQGLLLGMRVSRVLYGRYERGRGLVDDVPVSLKLPPRWYTTVSLVRNVRHRNKNSKIMKGWGGDIGYVCV
jgi:hypothetical protein